MFLKLTKRSRAKSAYRENFDQVKRYYPDAEGTRLEFMDGTFQIVEETCEQIDKMLRLPDPLVQKETKC